MQIKTEIILRALAESSELEDLRHEKRLIATGTNAGHRHQARPFRCYSRTPLPCWCASAEEQRLLARLDVERRIGLQADAAKLVRSAPIQFWEVC